MKVIQVSDSDIPGRRFNGHDIQIMLNRKGYTAKQFVCNKVGDDPNTIPLLPTSSDFLIREECRRLEESLSIQSLIYPFGEILGDSPDFLDADIVHYHLLFNHFMSLYSFKKLTKMKPTIWTLHDPWAITGHCVHPVECLNWLTGCHNCPNLKRYSPLVRDNSNSIWNIKREIYKDIDIDIVVASKWMYEKVKKSPLTSHFKRVHLIPFGIDLNLFKKRSDRQETRRKLHISENDIVIMFRQDDQEWKGLIYIKKMLKKLRVNKDIVLLTVGKVGLLKDLENDYRVIEYPWINNNNLLIDLYSSADFFLMSSIAESFGMMAIESMACELPVVVFNETALPSVTFAPECGIAVDKDNVIDYVEVVEKLVLDSKFRRLRGRIGRKLAEKHYNIKTYNQNLLKLYEKVYKEKYHK